MTNGRSTGRTRTTRQELHVTLPPLITQNHAYVNTRFRGRVLNQRARENMTTIEMLVSAAMAEQGWTTTDKEKVVVEFTHFWPDNRCRDTHNTYKCCLDAMANAKVFDNDRYVIVRQNDWHIDKENPRVEVMIYKLDDEYPLERCARCMYMRGFTDEGKVSCICGKWLCEDKKVPRRCKNFKERR